MSAIKSKDEDLPLSVLGPLLGQSAGLDPETTQMLQDYIRDNIREKHESREKEKIRDKQRKLAGVKLSKAYVEGQKRKTRICGQSGHAKPRNMGTRIVGFKLSNGQYSWICQRCQTLWFTPPLPGTDQMEMPRELLQQINMDEVGG